MIHTFSKQKHQASHETVVIIILLVQSVAKNQGAEQKFE